MPDEKAPVPNGSKNRYHHQEPKGLQVDRTQKSRDPGIPDSFPPPKKDLKIGDIGAQLKKEEGWQER